MNRMKCIFVLSENYEIHQQVINSMKRQFFRLK